MHLISSLLLALAPIAPPDANRASPQWAEGHVYPLPAAPGQISAIALEPGEKLISVAAGDTAQWVIGDTSSGSGETLRSHILVKPILPGLRTNMVITTDRRLYQVALESRPEAPIATLRWSYAAPGLIAVKALPQPACREAPDVPALNFGYRIGGDPAPWRPVRAFDDGRQVYIEFPPAFGQLEAPPLFLKGADGKLELVNYRVKGRYYVVDRLFASAELRLGEKKQLKVTIERTPERAPTASRSGS